VSSERHERIGALFLEACRLPPEERRAFLESACGGDNALLAEAESLLAHEDADHVSRAADALLEGALEASMPESIGGYRILARIGAGGMGVVYEAEQAEPSRRVALKVLRPGFASETGLRRLRYEAQVLSWLDHPSIARIYEAGTDDYAHGPDRRSPRLARTLARPARRASTGR